MKIIFLESVHNFGGSSRSTLELAKRLILHGHEVLIVDFWGCSIPYVEECEKNSIPYKIIDKRKDPILLNGKNKITTVINYLYYLKKIILYKTRMLQIINEFKPNLISVNNSKTLSILSSSKNHSIGYFARGWFLPKEISLFTRFLLKKRVDIFLTVSQATRQMVYAAGFAPLEDIYVISNGIDLKKNPILKQTGKSWDENSKRSFVLMHCGSFIETKGQHISIHVLKGLIDKGNDVKLLLVGLISKSKQSEDYFTSIKQLVKTYSLEKNVEFIVNKSDVSEYYLRSDMLIHPSYSEGLPRVVLEAMAYGNPVVGNAVGGMTDFILNNYTGFLTNFNSIEEYIERIEDLINDKIKYRFISNNASSLIKYNYTEENQIRDFLAVFNKKNI